MELERAKNMARWVLMTLNAGVHYKLAGVIRPWDRLIRVSCGN
ncbi:hypothetical protein NC652_023957 [Populus alba x Populus x berolinensis]|nr:hypothetical protein NC652_023957 [Populus alba x Populus x berolinensis]